ncbi:MAG: axeA 1 [Verrucomicrobiales bacterium]|nr:axeA 1 [Verrucomicrobiales bacterium]
MRNRSNRYNNDLLCVSRVLVLLVLVALVPGCITARREQTPSTGLWSRPELWSPPKASWGSSTGLVQELYYEGEPLNGKPTRVFAYLGRPSNPSHSKLPAMVLVHGGGGKAFSAWAEHWARQGYVALAMDLSGNGPNGRLPDGGPDQSDQVKFQNFTFTTATGMWTYHAVAAVLRGHSLLRSLPEVDPDRVGFTGISWGGYLTCIIAGVDHRFKVAVPVYGCGFLGDNSVWTDKSLAQMKPEARELWLKLFDPSQYLSNVHCPILFVNGTTDFAYPLDSYQKSYRLVPSKFRHISVAVNRPHGHIWTFPEVDVFVASVLKSEPAPVRIDAVGEKAGRLSAKLNLAVRPKKAELCYTTNTGVWQKRMWQTIPAQIKGKEISAKLPKERPLVAFLSITDNENAYFSSEHVELPTK